MNTPPKADSPALFSTFVMGLASASMIEMGLIEDPMSKTKRQELQVAQHYIDILGMLQKKTVGNLSDDEKQLLDRLLSDLRLQFVRLSTQKK